MEAVKLTECLPKAQNSALPSRCEQCGFRLRHRDKKWCAVCIKRWRCKQQRLESGTIEQLIEKTVHELFVPAMLEHLPEGIQKAFDGLTEDRGIMLWGKAGVGKTYSMAAMARYYLTEGYTVKFQSYDMLCSRIRSSYQQQAQETEYEIVNAYIEPDILFLDDVGTTVSTGGQESDFSNRTLLNILDGRLRRLRATFITSNKSVEQLASNFDERIASRIQQICEIIHCDGEDKRIK